MAETRTLAEAGEEAATTRRPDAATTLLAAAVAAVALMVGTIGPPLFGRGTFLAADAVTAAYPWRALSDPEAENPAVHGPIGDTVDSVFPSRAIFAGAARAGEFLGWNPYPLGGTALGADGSAGTASPFVAAYVVLPDWYAPAAIKLAQMAVAVVFTFLFCRLLGAGRLGAVVGGLAYAGSGFMVMWTNWPHPEVAAFVPALFWATERFLQRPSVRTGGPVALALAAMLLGNFPAVALHALYVLAPYVVVRLALMRDLAWTRALARAAGAGLAVLTGVALTAGVLLPFALRLDHLSPSREQTPDQALGLDTLVTTVAPKALGLSTGWPRGDWFGPYNQVEAVSFVGATTAVLALLAVALPRAAGTPRGAREVLAAATVVLGWATFVGGDLLALLQNLPGFGESFVGRTRAVLGFLVAVLAALGLQAVAERRCPAGARQRAAAAAVVGAAGLTAAYALNRARWRAMGADRVDVMARNLVLPAAVLAAAVAAALLARYGGRRTATVALAAVPVLLAVESLSLSLPLLPNEDRAGLYPRTPGVDFLASRIGHERMAAEGLTFFGSAASLYGLRRVTGHAFYAPTWKEAVSTVDPQAFARSGTFAFLAGTNEVMTSPLLDRLGARWFAATPQTQPAGEREQLLARSDPCDRSVALRRSLTVRVPAGTGLRGLVVHVCERVRLPADAAIVVDPAGGSLPARVPLAERIEPGELPVTVPAEDARGPGDLAVRLTLEGAGGASLRLAAGDGGRVAADAVRPANDGLRLAYVDDLVVYERLRAAPRIRWAGRARVVASGPERLALLASGTVDAGTVVLGEAAPPGSGAAGDVGIVRDTPTGVAVEVSAAGDGYLVVADALQHDWVARVDGERADLLDADHAGVAVHVPRGRHRVEIAYRPPGQRAGVAVSAASAATLAAAWARSAHRARRGTTAGRRGD